jgi:hypothetical protein
MIYPWSVYEGCSVGTASPVFVLGTAFEIKSLLKFRTQHRLPTSISLSKKNSWPQFPSRKNWRFLSFYAHPIPSVLPNPGCDELREDEIVEEVDGKADL